MNLELKDKSGSVSLDWDLAEKATATLLLAHGAGAGKDHPFMKEITEQLLKRNISVVRFNFPYMEAGRKSPGSPKKNIDAWKEVYDHVTPQVDTPLYIGGKSYGGRMASHLVAEGKASPDGIVYLGFPLHAPGKPGKDRADHLTQISCKQLFLQGTKDTLADINLMREVTDSISSAALHEMEGGDHSFKVKGLGLSETLARLAEYIRVWMDNR